ncbi:MAG TPA: class I SAM-dependent methyltransferase [Actinomycetota bacterium]|nr:class I SAM-dependent methyltransferase [Actinomycetota bacterium]
MHRAAAVGFERAADAYERGRPDFPDDAVAAIASALDLRPGRTVLDLGAGTGKLGRVLAPTGARVVAVEPVAAMRRTMRERAPDIDVLDATAEALPLGPGDADAAVAAQAFHWFDGPRALAELTRVLPADGGLALIWNVRDESTTWVRAITDLIEPYRGDTPSYRSMRWRSAFDATTDWTPPERTSFPYVHVTTRDAAVDRVTSISFIAALDAPERARVADEVRALLPADEEVAFPYRTDLWLSRRR